MLLTTILTLLILEEFTVASTGSKMDETILLTSGDSYNKKDISEMTEFRARHLEDESNWQAYIRLIHLVQSAYYHFNPSPDRFIAAGSSNPSAGEYKDPLVAIIELFSYIDRTSANKLLNYDVKRCLRLQYNKLAATGRQSGSNPYKPLLDMQQDFIDVNALRQIHIQITKTMSPDVAVHFKSNCIGAILKYRYGINIDGLDFTSNLLDTD